MKEKIAVIVCGNSGIDYIKHDYDIKVFRSNLHLGNQDYIDYIDITAAEFYRRIADNPNIDLKTSQTSTGTMRETYRELENQGFTDVIVITISSHLSGTYQNAVLAGQMVNKLKVHVFDSKTVSYPEAKMALVAAEMARRGASVEEILTELAYIRDNFRVYFSVDTLKFLVKNGRLSSTAGLLAGLFKIKPMLWITPEGKIETLEKIRTHAKAVERLKEKFLEDVSGIKKFSVFIAYTNNIDLVEEIAEDIQKARPDIKEIFLTPLTPVVGAHAGPGTFGIGYIIERD